MNSIIIIIINIIIVPIITYDFNIRTVGGTDHEIVKVSHASSPPPHFYDVGNNKSRL